MGVLGNSLFICSKYRLAYSKRCSSKYLEPILNKISIRSSFGVNSGEVELFLRLVDIVLSFLLADVLAACHYREKLSGIDTCFRIVPVLLQHLVQIHISSSGCPRAT